MGHAAVRLGKACAAGGGNTKHGRRRDWLKAKNCIITPHMSWGSQGSRQRIMDTTAENVKAFLAGSPVNVVNR